MASRWIVVSLLLVACGGGERPFPMRPPLARDTDTRPVGPRPEPYVSPQSWDVADNTIFRPLTRVFAVAPGGEAVNVNSLDEVPDSAWFENRDAGDPGPCAAPDLNPDDPDGSWIIDQGKPNGATPGFRVTIGARHFMFKVDLPDVAPRANAASLVGSRLYHAAGFFVACERIVDVRPALFGLKPGLVSKDNFGFARAFDRAALERMLAGGLRVGDRVRLEASEWIPGTPIGPFRYEGTRDDDPNDVIPHEDRRELRGARLVAAWLNHWDAREQNTLDTWIGGSRGHVRHYVLDFSDSLGSEWPQMPGIWRRLGFSYYLDFKQVGADFITFGAIERPWDRVEISREAPVFGYFSERDFEPEEWHDAYPNPAFDRMNERDGAWMARKIARIAPADLHAMITAARLAPVEEAYLERTLLARQRAILRRYLGRLSPLADVTAGDDGVCAVDLARRAGVFERFAYRATEQGQALAVLHDDGGRVCVPLAHRGGYRVITIHNGVAPGGLEIHLYDQGGGYFVAGLVRPDD